MLFALHVWPKACVSASSQRCLIAQPDIVVSPSDRGPLFDDLLRNHRQSGAHNTISTELFERIGKLKKAFVRLQSAMDFSLEVWLKAKPIRIGDYPQHERDLITIGGDDITGRNS